MNEKNSIIDLQTEKIRYLMQQVEDLRVAQKNSNDSLQVALATIGLKDHQ